MFGVGRRPQAESIMVLGREDDAFHTGIPGHPRPLPAIQGRRVKGIG
jgi:hypothetical protein